VCFPDRGRRDAHELPERVDLAFPVECELLVVVVGRDQRATPGLKLGRREADRLEGHLEDQPIDGTDTIHGHAEGMTPRRPVAQRVQR